MVSMEAYCMKCKNTVVVQSPKKIVMENGRTRFLDYAQEMAVVVDFLRSYLNANSQRESFISGCHSRTIRGLVV